MSITLYLIFINVFLLYQSTFSSIINRTRIKNVKFDQESISASNFSKYIYYNWNDSTTTTTSTTDFINILDVCNRSVSRENDPGIRKRSIEFWNVISSETTKATKEPLDVSRFSEDFLACIHTTVEPECYQRYRNGSVFVPLYNMLFDRSNYMIRNNLLFVCPDFFDRHEEKFDSSIGIISIIGVCISTACIILHIIMFTLFEELRNLPGYCLLSLCSALLVTYVCSFVQYTLSDHADCTAIGMTVFYSLLSSFFWMNVISFDVWKSIRMATTKLRLSSDRRVPVRFALYSSYAWGTPALIVIASLIIDHVSSDEKYKLNFRQETCWFQNRNALLIYFAVPLFIVLSLNLFFFTSSFYMITQSAMTRKESGTDVGSYLRSQLFLSLRLGSAMGLMWIFGVIATLTRREWLYYLYSVCIALQGVFIFFSFTVNDRTIKACKAVIRGRKISMSPTVTQ